MLCGGALTRLDRQRPPEKVDRLDPGLAGRTFMVHCRRIVIVESVASALVHVELCPRVMRESLPDRPLLLSRDVVVSIAEVEKDRASDLSGQAQRVRNR